MKDEIQYILSGTSQVKHHHLIQAACSYLKRSQASSTMAENKQQNKDQETKRLINNFLLNNLFFPDTAYKLLGFHLDQEYIICSCSATLC